MNTCNSNGGKKEEEQKRQNNLKDKLPMNSGLMKSGKRVFVADEQGQLTINDKADDKRKYIGGEERRALRQGCTIQVCGNTLLLESIFEDSVRIEVTPHGNTELRYDLHVDIETPEQFIDKSGKSSVTVTLVELRKDEAVFVIRTEGTD